MTYGSRLRQAMQERGVKRADLALHLGISQSAITQVLGGQTRMFDAANHIKACRYLRISPMWLATAEGTMEPPGFGISLVDHAAILDANTVAATLTREQIVSGSTPEEFQFCLDDDALAPDYPRGTALLWSTSKVPAPGSVMLLLDEANRLHVRILAEGTHPGEQLARAPNPNFASWPFSDRLRLVAVAKWRPMP